MVSCGQFVEGRCANCAAGRKFFPQITSVIVNIHESENAHQIISCGGSLISLDRQKRLPVLMNFGQRLLELYSENYVVLLFETRCTCILLHMLFRLVLLSCSTLASLLLDVALLSVNKRFTYLLTSAVDGKELRGRDGWNLEVCHCI